ncbi:MAG: cysteine peptidase family C39 domain-containing protein [Armatimonadota bacterium]
MAITIMALVSSVASAGVTANLSQQDDSVKEKSKLIKGVDSLKWGSGSNTFICSLATSLRASGEKVSNCDLVGLSGAAFKLNFNEQWCPSSPDATCGFDCAFPALEAFGYKWHYEDADPKDTEKAKIFRHSIKDAINKGYPVPAINLIQGADWGVITGYDKDGQEFLCRTYYNKTDEDETAQNWPWVVLILDEKTKAPALKDSFRKSLKLAIQLAKTEKYSTYMNGYAAYESWQSRLRDTEMFSKLKPEELLSTAQSNAWIYGNLIDARTNAKQYLRQYRNLLGVSASVHLEKTADLYEKEATLLSENRRYASRTWELKEGQQWTQIDRDKEAKILEKALALDKAAIAQIELALQKASQ